MIDNLDFSCYFPRVHVRALRMEVNMFVRFMLILCTLFAVVACHSKASISINGSIPVVVEEIDPAKVSTSTTAENCGKVRNELSRLDEQDENDDYVMIKRLELLSRHAYCTETAEWESSAMKLARVSIQNLADLHPNESEWESYFKQIKAVFALRPDAHISKAVTELIDLYQAIDTNLASTIVRANARLMESSFYGFSDLRCLVTDAVLREAMVYNYRHASAADHELDGVIGADPYGRVKDRLEFAKDIVDCFQNQDERAMPLVFFFDTYMDAAQRAELLIYVLAPSDEVSKNDLSDELDQRAQTYVAAGYDVTQVNAAVIEVFIEQDLFSDALAFSHKHFDETYTERLEDRLMKLLRDRGCYSMMEDPDGHKMRVFDFKQTCSHEEEDETEE